MKNICISLFCALLFFSSCAGSNKATHFEGFALGTNYIFTVKGKVPAGLQQKIDSVFATADASMSVFNARSQLSRLNRGETDSIDEHIRYCIELAAAVSELSGGKYDITIQPLSEAYGFAGMAQDENVNTDSLLAMVGYRKLRVDGNRLVKEHPGMKITLNSVAKGYIVDMQARMLEEQGIDEYLVNIGGEIFCRGKNPRGKRWTVSIDTPFEGNYAQGAYSSSIIAVSDAGVATSGNYRNFHTDSHGRKFTHIIDPLTGTDTESSLLSATVVAESCALADAYGTMLIAMGLDEAGRFLYRHPEIAALLIYADEEGDMKLSLSESMKQYMP